MDTSDAPFGYVTCLEGMMQTMTTLLMAAALLIGAFAPLVMLAMHPVPHKVRPIQNRRQSRRPVVAELTRPNPYSSDTR